MRRVCHIQFTSWPDFGVLRSAEPIIEALDLIQQYQQEGMNQLRQQRHDATTSPTNGHEDHDDDVITPSPVVIHCSAGVGRTGTFCCLSNSIESYHTRSCVDVYDTVLKIRSQRAFSVQTVEQYQFCYTGILEYVIKDRTSKGLDTDQADDLLHGLIG